jgi:multidrug transporter EmrE-like cation transporter
MKFLLYIPPIIWVFMGICFLTYGDYLSKLWAYKPTIWLFLFTILVYSFSACFWFPAIYQKNQIATMGTIWQLMGVIGAMLVGLLIFHEHLVWYQWLGLVLAIVSMLLLG